MTIGEAPPLAEYASPPIDTGTTTVSAVTEVALYTATPAPQVDALPTEWYGRYVRVTASAANVWWFFTLNAAAVPVVPTATAAGTRTIGAGARWPAGYAEDVVLQVPQRNDGETIYLARISDHADGGLEVRLR
jgi:hypothetical protein